MRMLLFGAALALAGCPIAEEVVEQVAEQASAETRVGSGVSKTESREVAPFTGIELHGQLHLGFEEGPEQTVRLTADDNLHEFITADVDGGTLRLGIKNGSYNWKTTPTFTIVGEGVSDFSLHGQSRATLSGLTPEALSLELHGQSHVTASTQSETISVDAGGQSRCILKGTADRVDVDAGGQSSVDVRDLTAGEIRGDLGGQSRLDTGNAANVHVDTSGQARVK